MIFTESFLELSKNLKVRAHFYLLRGVILVVLPPGNISTFKIQYQREELYFTCLGQDFTYWILMDLLHLCTKLFLVNHVFATKNSRLKTDSHQLPFSALYSLKKKKQALQVKCPQKKVNLGDLQEPAVLEGSSESEFVMVTSSVQRLSCIGCAKYFIYVSKIDDIGQKL